MPEVLTSDTVQVSLIGERARFNLRIKSSDLAAVKKASGLKLPTKINTMHMAKDVICAKLGPDEWIVICSPKTSQALFKKLKDVSKDFVCSVTEISHRNVGFEISGNEAAAMINVGCPQDLSLEKFPVGKATRTVFESASIILMRTNDNKFHIEVWRSFGPYLRDFFYRIVTT